MLPHLRLMCRPKFAARARACTPAAQLCSLRTTTSEPKVWQPDDADSPGSVEEVREFYDKWAGSYEGTLEAWGWEGPERVAEAFSRCERKIYDAQMGGEGLGVFQELLGSCQGGGH